MPDSFYRRDGENLVLKVRVQPGASRTEITGVINGELRLRLSAPATDGRANDKLREFLADQLDTAVSRVRIVRGSANRSKTVVIAGARHAPEILLNG